MKPRAYYDHTLATPEVGRPVYVVVAKHPNPNIYGDLILTSNVVRVGPVGEFETENTLYFPKQPIKDDE